MCKIKVIVWDNCTKMNYRGFENLDIILREICDKEQDILFAGIPVLLAGDFRPTFPLKGGINETQADETQV